MSYVDMARSHVKEMAREAFGLDEVVVDGDGDLPFRHGTSVYYASVVQQGRVLRVWSAAVSGLHVQKAVLREINSTNRSLIWARVYAYESTVTVEGCLPIESLRAEDLAVLCREVGGTADRLGSLLAAVHGGSVALPEHADGDEEDEIVEAAGTDAGAQLTCPTCGSTDAVPILYGMPLGPEEPGPAAVDFGGCCPMPAAPRYRCRGCGASWGVWPDVITGPGPFDDL